MCVGPTVDFCLHGPRLSEVPPVSIATCCRAVDSGKGAACDQGKFFSELPQWHTRTAACCVPCGVWAPTAEAVGPSVPREGPDAAV